MKELIPITRQCINEIATLTCDGRALHTFLESKQEYANWIKNRIEKYGFVEGVDYVSLDKIIKREIGATTRIDHILTIDMAKQLAMVENNDKGAEVRRYFIECERIAKEAASGYKTRPRRSSDAELNARSAATSYRMMARMKNIYPPEMCAVFAAKSVALLTGEPLEAMLPRIAGNRDHWLSPTDLGVKIGVNRNAIGRALKALGLHGEDDANHEWSQPVWNKSPYSEKQVKSYLYDPAVVLNPIEEYLTTPKPALSIVNSVQPSLIPLSPKANRPTNI